MPKVINLDGLTEYDTKLKEFLDNTYIKSSNQSIKNIVELSYEDYKVLQQSGQVDPNTEYHIKDAASNIDQLQQILDSLQSQIDALPAQIMNLEHPVGSLEFNFTGINPATYLGVGTWVQIKDRFLLAAGDIYAVNSTGGEATHILTVDEMPSHTHTQPWGIFNTSGSGWYGAGLLGTDGGGRQTSGWTGNNPQSTGGSQAHNNMPPYVAVYIWQRTA